MRNLLNETILMEQFAIEILEKNGFKNLVHISRENPQSDYDIGNDVGSLRFDVKYASPRVVARNKRVPIWSFDLRKGERKKPRKTDLDYYACIGLKHNRPEVLYLIPKNDAPTCHLRISAFGRSKWHKYEIWSRK